MRITHFIYLIDQVDRMAADCAIELRKSKVAMVSLWPGAVQTEIITDIIEKGTGLNEGQASGDGDPNVRIIWFTQ